MPATKKNAVGKSKKKPVAKSRKKVTAKKANLDIVRSSAYKGSKIEVVAKKVGHAVHLDGKMIDTGRDPDTGAYVSPDLPYSVYGSLEEVAQAIVDAKKGG